MARWLSPPGDRSCSRVADEPRGDEWSPRQRYLVRLPSSVSRTVPMRSYPRSHRTRANDRGRPRGARCVAFSSLPRRRSGRSLRHREQEVGDAISLDTLDRVAQRSIVRVRLTEEGAALAHHDGQKVNGTRVQQAELEALPRNGPGRYSYGARAGDLLCPCNRRVHAVGDEVEGSVWV